MIDLLLFPFGGNAREAVAVIDAINKSEKKWNLLGFVDDDPQKKGVEAHGYKVLGNRSLIQENPLAKILAVPGSPENYFKRKELIDSLKLPEDRFATLIHPQAQIGHNVTIGHNTLIMSGVVTTVDVTIGNHCVVRPNAVISHDVHIGEHCLIGSNVSISGSVILKNNCYIGAGAQLIQHITVSEHALVGIGSVVLKNVEPNTVVVGNPARILKKLTPK